MQFTQQGISVCPATQGLELGEHVAAGRAQFWQWEAAAGFFAALPELLYGQKYPTVPHPCDEADSLWLEQRNTGHRMLIFYGEKDMPLAQYWEALARLVKLTGEEWVTYSLEPPVVITPAEAEARAQLRLPKELRELRTNQTLPHPRGTRPDLNIEPQIILTEGE